MRFLLDQRMVGADEARAIGMVSEVTGEDEDFEQRFLDYAQTLAGVAPLAAGEGDVDLPFATEEQVAAHRAHPLHLLVHLGEPGTNVAIGVAGTASDPCIDSGDYVNR